MTKEQIIRMANDAGIDCDADGDIWGSTNGSLERFAALVAAAERDLRHAFAIVTSTAVGGMHFEAMLKGECPPCNQDCRQGRDCPARKEAA